MIKEEQNPTGPVLTAAESRRRVLHNMCSSLLYNLSVILFGLLLPRLYLTSFGSELNGLDSTIKQIFSCLTLLEAGVGLASQQAYYLPVAVGDRKAINGIFSATHHYYRRTGIVYLLVTVVFALLYPLCINTVLSYGTVSLIVVFYGIPGIVSYLVQGKYRSFMEVEGKNYVITYITTATMAAGNLLRMLALLFTRSILLVQVTYCVPSVCQVLVLTAYMRKNYPWLNAHDTPNLEALAQRGSVLVHQKSSHGFTRFWPSVATLVLMALSFFLLASALKHLPIGTAYAVWTGIGAVGTALLGIVLFGESASPARLLCIGLILAGIAGLKLLSDA